MLGESREAPGGAGNAGIEGQSLGCSAVTNSDTRACPGLGPVLSHWKQCLHSYKLFATLSNGAYLYKHRLPQE